MLVHLTLEPSIIRAVNVIATLSAAVNNRFRLVPAAALVGLLLCGCRPANSVGVNSMPHNTNTSPWLLIYRTPAYPIPGTIERTLTYAAVWNDMRIIRVTSPVDLKAQPRYFTGHLSSKDMTRLRELVHHHYSHSSATEPSLLLDAGAFHLILRANDQYVTDAVSEPLSHNSSIYQVLQLLLASDILDSHIIDFTGAPPQSWVEH